MLDGDGFSRLKAELNKLEPKADVTQEMESSVVRVTACRVNSTSSRTVVG